MTFKLFVIFIEDHKSVVFMFGQAWVKQPKSKIIFDFIHLIPTSIGKDSSFGIQLKINYNITRYCTGLIFICGKTDIKRLTTH